MCSDIFLVDNHKYCRWNRKIAFSQKFIDVNADNDDAFVTIFYYI